jgi:hypothetical protein
MKKSPRARLLCRGGAIALAAAAGLLLLSFAGWAASRSNPAKGKASGPATEAATAVDGGIPPAKADTVRITIQTVPPRKASVRWGNKTLGVIPTPQALVVERPRDSGPLDLVIRAAGFLPVHTRAYTFSDSRVAVKLTPPAEKSKLFGYRQEPAPPPDAGAPPEPPPAIATPDK